MPAAQTRTDEELSATADPLSQLWLFSGTQMVEKDPSQRPSIVTVSSDLYHQVVERRKCTGAVIPVFCARCEEDYIAFENSKSGRRGR